MRRSTGRSALKILPRFSANTCSHSSGPLDMRPFGKRIADSFTFVGLERPRLHSLMMSWPVFVQDLELSEESALPSIS